MLITDASLKKLNTWRVGGKARQLFKPDSIDALQQFLPTLPTDQPPIWLGLGSNILIADSGIDNTVILTTSGLNKLDLLDDDVLRFEAGVTCAKAAKFCVKHNFADAEFFAGIPGTIGGALAMNAGAFDGETWRYLTKVETIDQQGTIRVRSADEFIVSYRHVVGPGISEEPREWFIAGYFKLPKGDGLQTQKNIKALLKKRSSSQPIGLPSCGSVFINPPGNYAAKLIEQCELKGFRIGGAEISTKHANFIINTGNATAQEIADLISYVQQTVMEQTEIALQTEVRFLGFDK